MHTALTPAVVMINNILIGMTLESSQHIYNTENSLNVIFSEQTNDDEFG